ncbi:hypothetical protein WJX74_004555 [Apatococcus lobatus]|uniref:Uncharacterized protein n=1 Tax=Apatococcus lobatus TaxID=904363 RepID=A0AAW1RYV3_9CHLO
MQRDSQRHRGIRSGGGVLCISTLQFMTGLILLGIYEGFRAHAVKDSKAEDDASRLASVLTYRKTLDFLFYLSMINNIFSIFGFAGVLNAQKELVTGFFAFNAVQMVVAFHYFVDVVTDTTIRYKNEPTSLTSYEQSAAAFLFFNFILSVAATVFALQAIDEIKTKQREDFNRLSVLSDTLQFENDS